MAVIVLATAFLAWQGVDAGARRLAAAQRDLLPRVLALEQLRLDTDVPLRAIDAFAAQAVLSRFNRGRLGDERPRLDEAWQAFADALAAYTVRHAVADDTVDRPASARPSILVAGQHLLDAVRDAAAGIDDGASPVARADSGRVVRAGVGQFRAVLDGNLGQARGALAAQLTTASASIDRAWWILGAAVLPLLVLTLAGASVIVRRAAHPGPVAAGATGMARRRPAIARRRLGHADREMTMIDDWLGRALATYPLPAGIALNAELVSGAHAALERERFRRVLVILLDNAVRAMSDASSATDDRRPCTITVRSEAAGPHVRLSVIDTGPGIPAERLARIFDGAPGKGDGLPIVRQIVEEHGGTVDIESAMDQGTDVVIWLPRQLAEVAALPTAQEEAAA